MKKLLFLLVVVLISGCVVNIETNEEEFKVEVLVKNLDTPWAIDFLPEGSMIFTERDGGVSVYDKGKVKIIGNIEVSEISESGLMGIAVDPDFSENKFSSKVYKSNMKYLYGVLIKFEKKAQINMLKFTLLIYITVFFTLQSSYFNERYFSPLVGLIYILIVKSLDFNQLSRKFLGGVIGINISLLIIRFFILFVS